LEACDFDAKIGKGAVGTPLDFRRRRFVRRHPESPGAGDFSHRILVRKTKDQLSDLAGSFNAMTARIEDLIVQAKEKGRLENELAIARDVQSTLFPKEIPQAGLS
jgi:hypothetical protein